MKLCRVECLPIFCKTIDSLRFYRHCKPNIKADQQNYFIFQYWIHAGKSTESDLWFSSPLVIDSFIAFRTKAIPTATLCQCLFLISGKDHSSWNEWFCIFLILRATAFCYFFWEHTFQIPIRLSVNAGEHMGQAYRTLVSPVAHPVTALQCGLQDSWYNQDLADLRPSCWVGNLGWGGNPLQIVFLNVHQQLWVMHPTRPSETFQAGSCLLPGCLGLEGEREDWE